MKWTEQQSYIRNVYSEWEQFLSTGNTDGLKVRPEILESWQRSYQNGISPEQLRAKTILNDELLQKELKNKKDLIDAASPLLEELGQILTGTGHVLNLSNSEAVILRTIGDNIALKYAERDNLLPGGGIGESVFGTTGAALVISKHKPVTILATEHFCTGPKEWAAAVAPIIDSTNKELVGILSLSLKYTNVNRHTVGIVISAARAIESRLLEQYLWRREALLKSYMENVLRQRADLIVAIDNNGHVVEASFYSHPLLVAQNNFFSMVPILEKSVRAVLINPNQARTCIDRIELQDGHKYTLTYSPVFKENTICGFLLYVYGIERNPVTRRANGSESNTRTINNEKNSMQKRLCKELVGVAPGFKRMLELAMRAACTDATIIITGETGVGKEGVARAVHEYSPRSQGPFIEVNCGAIPKELIAGELFGYVPGAFTGASPKGNTGKFEAANGGTLFLDELGSLSKEAQAYLLRVLQEKEVIRLGSYNAIPIDVRVIAATNSDLRQLVREGHFREDLYFRLSVVEIQVPPLRDRPEDLPHLIAYFLSGYGIYDVKLSENTIQTLAFYKWPGNIRELMNIVQRVVALDLDLEETLLDYVKPHIENIGIISKKEDYEDKILSALQSSRGNITQAARELGVARSTIYRYMKGNKVNINRNININE